MSLSSTSKLLLGFVTLIIGVMLLGTIAGQSNATTAQKLSTDSITVSYNGTVAASGVNTSKVYTLANAFTGNWKADSPECTVSTISLANQTGSVLTATTDYTYTSVVGTLQLKDTGNVNKSTTLTAQYGYCGDDYITQSWGRTAINLVSGLFAIALLLISVGIFYSVAKEYGLWN